ncbi:hypothetical protein SDC9_168275 [bioreactor metagenome]|uniref:NAD-specific glutamate dehydrogenase n=1 Tax=bioreactor metagenome TaxID=1076179 RepID=A0A645G430_9ZZZZ
MNHRQHSGFGGERTEILDAAPVGAELAFENRFAGAFAHQIVEAFADFDHVVRSLFLELGSQSLGGFVLKRVQRLDPGGFAGDQALFGNTLAGAEFDQLGVEFFRNQVERRSLLSLAGQLLKFELGGNLNFHHLVGKIHRLFHLLLGDKLGGTFDHDDLVGGTGISQIDGAFPDLGIGRVGDQLAVDLADAHRADRAHERQFAQGQCDARTEHHQHIRLGLAFGGEQ